MYKCRRVCIFYKHKLFYARSCVSSIYNSGHSISTNRKEGNDQESIKFSNTFRPRYLTERRTHLKQRHRNQNTASRRQKKKKVSFPLIGQMAIKNNNKKKNTRTYKTACAPSKDTNRLQIMPWLSHYAVEILCLDQTVRMLIMKCCIPANIVYFIY